MMVNILKPEYQKTNQDITGSRTGRAAARQDSTGKQTCETFQMIGLIS